MNVSRQILRCALRSASFLEVSEHPTHKRLKRRERRKLARAFAAGAWISEAPERRGKVAE